MRRITGVAVAVAVVLIVMGVQVVAPTAPARADDALFRPRAGQKAGPLAHGTSAPAGPARAAVAGISGQVTANGDPVAGVDIQLRQYQAGVNIPVLTTTTTITGHFAFANPPTPPEGWTYYAYYGPNTTDPAYVFEWLGPDIVGYTEGSAADAGSLDIADAPLLAPPPNAVMATFPITFTFTPRQTPNTAYYVDLARAGSGISIGPPYLSLAPGTAVIRDASDIPGFVPGSVYLWQVLLEDGAYTSSYGHSFEARPVTIGLAANRLYLPLVAWGNPVPTPQP